jgi:hypothetical protein
MLQCLFDGGPGLERLGRTSTVSLKAPKREKADFNTVSYVVGWFRVTPHQADRGFCGNPHRAQPLYIRRPPLGCHQAARSIVLSYVLCPLYLFILYPGICILLFVS